MADTLHNPTVKGVEDLTLADTAPRVLMSAGDPAPTAAYQEVRSTSCYEAGYREATTWDELVTLQTAGTPSLVCSALTVGASVTLDGAPIKFTPTGSLDLNGFTLALDSQVINPDNHQIFLNFNSGDVRGHWGGVQVRFPEWWGAFNASTNQVGDTSSSAAFKAAMNSGEIQPALSADQLQIEVRLNGQYRLTETLVVPKNTHLVGVSERSTLLFFHDTDLTTGDYAIQAGDQAGINWNFDVQIRDLYILLAEPATKTIGAITTIGALGEGTTFRNLRIGNFTGTAINFGNFACLGVSVRHIHITQAGNDAAGEVGIEFGGGTQMVEVQHLTVNASTGLERAACVKITNSKHVSLQHLNVEDADVGVKITSTSNTAPIFFTASHVSATNGTTPILFELDDQLAGTASYYNIESCTSGITGIVMVDDIGAVAGPGLPGPSFRLASYQRYGATPGVIL